MSKLETNEISPKSAPGIGIGAPTIQPSAIVNVQSTEQGTAPFPRMTTAQRDLIISPIKGLFVYNIDNDSLEHYNGSSWESTDGVQSINGQISKAQIINTGSAGTAPNVTQSGTDTNTINIPNAVTPGVTAGLISKSQYDSFDTRQYPVKNIKYVVGNAFLGPQDYNSIVDALASITDNSSTNPYLIKVGPGIYTGTVVAKPYVWIEGSEQDQTIIVASSGNHAVIGANISGISKCLIRGATTSGKAAVYYASTTGTTNTSFMVEDCRFGDNDYLAISDATSAPTAIFIESCKYGSIYQFNHGFLARFGGRVVLRNSTTTGLTAPYPDFVYKAIGTGSELTMNGVQTRSGTVTSGACVHLADGAKLRALSLNIKQFGKGIYIENTGAASIVDAVGVLCEDNTVDIQVDHPGADGTFNGSADHNKIIVNPSSSFSVVISCNASPNDGTGQVIVGTVLQGDRYDRLANLSKLARESTTLGVISGGTIQNPVSLNVDITAGTGFLIDPTNIFVKEISWNNTTLSVPANSIRYVYVDTNGVVSQSASTQSLITTIPLGRVTTNATDIRFIESVEMDMVHVGNKIEKFLRDLGPVFSTGAITSENGTRGLNVTAGSYNYGVNPLTLSGGTGISWTAIYRNGSGGWTEGSQSTVSNSNYDDGSGTLASIPAGRFVNHTLYVIGHSGNEKYFLVYSQDTHPTSSDAQAADLPLVPPYISEGVARLAGIIVQQGATNFSEIVDLRPRIGFAAPSSAGTTDHGNLLGLLDDDHTQYLLVNGSRPMSGNLDMGGQNVTNVNLVDGVDVSAHAARHLPTGADPLATAAPSANLSATTTNSTGTANSLARSDHSHALTTGTPSTQVPDQANATGSSSNLARADHIHQIATASPSGTIGANSVNGQGISTSFTRSDHQHQLATGTPSTQTTDQANAAGSSNNLARADHVHNIPTATAISISTSTTNTQGASSSFARANHTHAVSITNSQASATADTTTTSATDVLMNAMTLTPAAGTYLAMFSTSLECSSDDADITISIYFGGTQVAHTERVATPNVASSGVFNPNGANIPIATQCIVTVNGSQAIEARWRRTAGTATAHERTLTIIKLA